MELEVGERAIPRVAVVDAGDHARPRRRREAAAQAAGVGSSRATRAASGSAQPAQRGAGRTRSGRRSRRTAPPSHQPRHTRQRPPAWRRQRASSARAAWRRASSARALGPAPPAAMAESSGREVIGSIYCRMAAAPATESRPERLDPRALDRAWAAARGAARRRRGCTARSRAAWASGCPSSSRCRSTCSTGGASSAAARRCWRRPIPKATITGVLRPASATVVRGGGARRRAPRGHARLAPLAGPGRGRAARDRAVGGAAGAGAARLVQHEPALGARRAHADARVAARAGGRRLPDVHDAGPRHAGDAARPLPRPRMGHAVCAVDRHARPGRHAGGGRLRRSGDGPGDAAPHLEHARRPRSTNCARWA